MVLYSLIQEALSDVHKALQEFRGNTVPDKRLLQVERRVSILDGLELDAELEKADKMARMHAVAQRIKNLMGKKGGHNITTLGIGGGYPD